MKKIELLKLTLLYAFISEGIPIIAQLVFIVLHNLIHPINWALNDDFMVSRGFYVFQIAGFFLSFVFFYMLIVNDKGRHLNAAIFFFLISVGIEFSFYLFTPVTFRFVYIYSFLDKFMAILLAVFTYLVYKDSFYNLIADKRQH